MAKIKDLGISVIPMTMRPLEIGPGAGFDIADAPAAMFLCAGSQCVQCLCDPGTAFAETSCDPSGDCMPSGQPECAEHSCKHSHHHDHRHAGGFTEDDVAQLKQQLRDRIANELEN